MKVKVTGVGHFIPEKVIDNKYLSMNYAISESDIFKKTGIKQRRYVDEGATTTDIVCYSITNLLKKYNKSINDVDCIIVGTLTPDYFFPSTAVSAINKLKAKKAWGFDLSAACSGFCYGMTVAASMIQQGTIRNAIVCGAERMSETVNSFDYKTKVLFGDGAGAVMLEAATDKEEEVIVGNLCKVEADDLEDVYYRTPFNTKDWTHEIFELQGGKVYRNGVRFMTNSIKEYLKKARVSINDFDYVIPHQSNLRMIEDVVKGLKTDISKFCINIESIGNTGGASIPVCLSDFVEKGSIKKGDRLLLCSFGSGYTISIIDLIWAI